MRISRIVPTEMERQLVEVDKKKKKFQFYETTSSHFGGAIDYTGLHQWQYDGLTFHSPEQVLEYILREKEKSGGTILKVGEKYNADVESVSQKSDRIILNLKGKKGQITIFTS